MNDVFCIVEEKRLLSREKKIEVRHCLICMLLNIICYSPNYWGILGCQWNDCQYNLEMLLYFCQNNQDF